MKSGALLPSNAECHRPIIFITGAAKSGALLPSNAECHRPIIFITEPRSGEVINLIGR